MVVGEFQPSGAIDSSSPFFELGLNRLQREEPSGATIDVQKKFIADIILNTFN